MLLDKVKRGRDQPRCPLNQQTDGPDRREDTQVIPRNRIPINSRNKFDNSMEKRCQLVFDGHKIRFPTSFILLPYELKLDERQNTRTMPSRYLDIAAEIGKCLLDVNTTTAKLTFWLQMKSGLSPGTSIRSKMKRWMKRARTEPTDKIAREILDSIACEEEYTELCQEVLETEDSSSKASAFIDDPIEAASEEIRESIYSLLKCYRRNDVHFLYFIDELEGLPSAKPLHIKADPQLVERVFLPFMHLSMMTNVAAYGLPGLARLLGLPPTCGVPFLWRSAAIGLVHGLDRPYSITAFATLQRTVRMVSKGKDDRTTISSRKHTGDIPGVSYLSEVELLAKVYSKYDPKRNFSGLKRVSDGLDCAVWCSGDAVKKLREDNRVTIKSLGKNALRTLRRVNSGKAQTEDAMAMLSKSDEMGGSFRESSSPTSKLQRSSSRALPHSLRSLKKQRSSTTLSLSDSSSGGKGTYTQHSPKGNTDSFLGRSFTLSSKQRYCSLESGE